MDLNKYINQQLKECLQRLGEKTTGNKRELIVRLQVLDARTVLQTLEEISRPPQTNDGAHLLDAPLDEGDGKDPIATLSGEVAILKDTVGLLVQQLQNLITAQQVVPTLALDTAAVPIIPASRIIEAAASNATMQDTGIAQCSSVHHDCSC